MKGIDPKHIFLIEDHYETLNVWRKLGAKNLALIHLDAHIDFGFQNVKETSLAIKEARSIAELKSELEKSILFKRKEFEFQGLTNIGNYIYPAMRDSIVKEFYWVIPGDKEEFRRCLKLLKRILKGLSLRDPKPSKPAIIRDGYLKTRLYGNDFIICCLERLPRIKSPCLLDIDTDFLVIPSLLKANNVDEIGRRKPWLQPEGLTKALKKKIYSAPITTIAYSVNGGYTPMIYKGLGDRVAQSLGLRGVSLNKRIRAADAFRKFREFLDMKNFDQAKTSYELAILLNPAYRGTDNNYGSLYMQINKQPEALKEFSQILRIDPRHAPSLAALGNIMLLKKKIRAAKNNFSKALRLDAGNKTALLGLANSEFKLKNYWRAKQMYIRYIRLEPMYGPAKFNLARIYELGGQPAIAFNLYEEALQLGVNDSGLLTRLIRLSSGLKKGNPDYFKKRLAEFKKNLRRIERLKQHLRTGRNNR